MFIAFALAALAYLHSDIFIDFADEGFLWYGSTHISQGQVPILDFQSYEPGRYYWCAAVFWVFGKGLMSLRLAEALFQFVGLCFGLFALKRALTSSLSLLGAGLIAVFFMLVPCRYFSASLPLIALFFAVRLIEKPSLRRHVAAGICTGLMVFLAINQSFYVFGAFLALMLYLNAKGCVQSAARKRLFFIVGIGIGLVPMACMFLMIPGFWESYLDRLTMIASAFGQGKANVSLPISWPWLVKWDAISRALPSFHARALEYANLFSGGFIFIIVIVYYFISVPALIRFKKIQEPPKALFVASVFVGLFHLGHIFSRSDLVYMGEGIFPVWAGLLAWQAWAQAPVFKRMATGLVIFFSLAAFFAVGLRHNIIFKMMVPKGGMTWYSVGKDRIWLLHSDAEYCDSFKKLVTQYVKPEELILLAPLLTTFYCLLEKESPVYELYFHIAPSPATEERLLRQLEQKKVRWAIVGNLQIDGHPEQTLPRSHPRLWEYLMRHFEVVTNQGLRPGYCLMRRKF